MLLFFLHMITMFIFFFFSSRRRHTRCGRDWSSDVCSSDLSLPVRVDVETTVDGTRLAAGERRSGKLKVILTITNATAVEAQSFEAEPEPVSLAQVVDRI